MENKTIDELFRASTPQEEYLSICDELLNNGNLRAIDWKYISMYHSDEETREYANFLFEMTRNH